MEAKISPSVTLFKEEGRQRSSTMHELHDSLIMYLLADWWAPSQLLIMQRCMHILSCPKWHPFIFLRLRKYVGLSQRNRVALYQFLAISQKVDLESAWLISGDLYDWFVLREKYCVHRALSCGNCKNNIKPLNLHLILLPFIVFYAFDNLFIFSRLILQKVWLGSWNTTCVDQLVLCVEKMKNKVIKWYSSINIQELVHTKYFIFISWRKWNTSPFLNLKQHITRWGLVV